jgi:YidC/Oxa1 family membrane protein insertase
MIYAQHLTLSARDFLNMDRRTLLFAVGITTILFLVNLYFDSDYEDKLRQWNASQEVKKKQQVKYLESELLEKTLPADKLPLAIGYSDKEGKKAVAGGVLIDDSFLTSSWAIEPPKSIFVSRYGSKDTPRELKLTSSKGGIGSPVLYQENEKSPLLIGQLPDVGTYELQAVLYRHILSDEVPQVYLAEVRDGNVTIIKDRLSALKHELDSQSPQDSVEDGLFLLLNKNDDSYLPVAFYDKASKSALFLEDVPSMNTRVAASSKDQAVVLGKNKDDQKYYVLENDYQQLVFTNVGGALTEINLPFTSSTNTLSAVRPIEVDRDMVADHAYNAHFPAHPYLTPGSSPDKFVENPVGKLGGYYPLIRRDLIEDSKRPSVKLNPRFYAMNLLSEYPEFAELIFTVKQFDSKSITFEAQQRQRRIIKTYSLPVDKNAPYIFDLTIKIEGDKRGLWLSSGIPEVELFSDSPAPVLKYRITRNQKPYVEAITLPEGATTNSSVNPDWLCNSNGFFGIIIDPLNQVDAGFRAVHVPGQNAPSRIVEIDQNYEKYEAKNFPGYMMMTPLSSSSNTMNFRIFAGPFSGSILKSVDSIYSDSATGYNPDYIACQSYHGWFSFISEPFAKLLFMMMSFFHSLTGSWALSIVLLTAALRVMLYPLNAWSTRSMLRMQQIAPKVSALQDKYKKDPKKLQLEMMNLYREEKVNPMSGCVPMLIQMPFLIGMFDLLKSTFELRGAGFIPGWIDNLTAPDVLFSWSTPIFFIGNQFHLLPILLGLVMFLQQKMSAPAIPVGEMTDQQRQQRALTTIMPIMFMFMFYNFPSGLNIYWLSSMLLAMLQQWWMQKNMKPSNTTVITEKTKKA